MAIAVGLCWSILELLSFTRLVTLVLVRVPSLDAFAFTCREKEFQCTLENWSPTVEGSFVLRHVPSSVGEIELLHLQDANFDASIMDEIHSTVHTLRISESPTLRSLAVPSNGSLQSILILDSSLSHFQAEQNSDLRTIIIQNSPIRDVLSALSRTPNLSTLNLLKTNVHLLDTSLLCDLEQLTGLELQNNKITDIVGNTSAVCQTPLLTINLMKNLLKSVDLEQISLFSELYSLDISQNRLEYLTGALTSGSLQWLSLAYNRLKGVDFCQWTSQPNLEVVTLSANSLERVPACLSTLRNVQSIVLKQNLIATVSMDDFKDLPSLNLLDLSRNKIVSFLLRKNSFPVSLERLLLDENEGGANLALNISDKLLRTGKIRLSKS